MSADFKKSINKSSNEGMAASQQCHNERKDIATKDENRSVKETNFKNSRMSASHPELKKLQLGQIQVPRIKK